jgi:CheY-like chemotaxis protein
VLDVEMPRLDGIAAFKSIPWLRPDLPVIVVSANPKYERQALDAGASAFVCKGSTYYADVRGAAEALLRKTS